MSEAMNLRLRSLQFTKMCRNPNPDICLVYENINTLSLKMIQFCDLAKKIRDADINSRRQKINYLLCVKDIIKDVAENLNHFKKLKPVLKEETEELLRQFTNFKEELFVYIMEEL